MSVVNVLNDCVKLVFYGEVDWFSRSVENAVYIDPFGCDLTIYCRRHHEPNDVTVDFVEIYLGGRRVFKSYDNIKTECFVDGYWVRLVYQLCQYEYAKENGDEPPRISSTLIELVKREAKNNRRIMNKYRSLGVFIAKRKGERVGRVPGAYKNEDTFRGHKI